MFNLIKYIADSLKPKDDTEFIQSDNFNISIFNRLKQDGFYVIFSDEDVIDNSIDMITINKYRIIRKNSPKQIEWLNNDNTFSFVYNSEPLYRRLVPPPWETIDHALIIYNIINITNNNKSKNYLEYGVRTGETLEKISNIVNISYGVDLCDYKKINDNVIFYKMLTDEFSKEILHTITFDYAFIDADHSFNQAYIDFKYIYDKLNINGYIFLHDTYPCMEENLKPSACNDCYKTPLEIRKNYKDIEILTIPINPGLTIVRKTR